MMSSITRSGYLFTASQWQELEHQALIYKYMVSGMPIPPDLLYTIRRSSLDTSLISSKLILHQPQHVGWNYLQLGFGKKIDPEPGRCRRTDGKKWRCSKEAYQESKYCERHMHRGRNRSRKPVEVMTLTKSTNSSTRTTTTAPLTAIPISSPEPHHSFLYAPYSSSRPPGIGLSSQDHTKSLLDSGAYSRNSYDHGLKEEPNKHIYYSEASGTMRSASGSSSIVDDSSWQLAPLTMGSPLGHLKQRTNYSVSQNGHSYLQLQSLNNESSKQHHQRQDQYYYAQGNDVKTENMHMKIDSEDHQPKKVMHHFFDELPREDNKDSWLDSEDIFAKTHLSISVPNSSHDFFITPNGN